MTAAAAPPIELVDVHKIYEDRASATRALRGVSLSVAAGEIVAIMGPSGSGKTTLLSIMGCLLRPTSGTVRILGADVTACDEGILPAVRRAAIGFVFQQFNLLSALTARENVEVGLGLRGVRGPEASRRTAEMLARVGLSHREHHRPRDLSGGEKQRVSIARALASEPPVVLADEPTGNLDSETGRRVVELLARLARSERRAVVIVTHDERVADVADRVHRLRDGRLAG